MAIGIKKEVIGAGAWLVAAVVLPLVAVVLFGVCLTMFRLAGAPEVNIGPTRVGESSAVIKSCDRRGPVSSEGFGYFWECDAEVAVNGHSVGTVKFDPDELTPADAAERVGVQRSGDSWRRDVSHPYRLLHVAGLAIVAVDFIVALAALVPLLGLVLLLIAQFRRKPASDEAANSDAPKSWTSVEFMTPGTSKRRTPILTAVLGLSGVFLLAVGGWMLYINAQLSADVWGGAAASTIILFGLVSLIAAGWWAFAPERPGDIRTIELTEAGIKQSSDSEESTLPWEALRSVVFDDRGRPGRISAHLTLVDDASKEKLLKEYRRPSKHGVLLTPEITREQAELASEAIEGFCPGLAHWRSRELARSGFGPGKNSGPRLVRWKDGATAASEAVADVTRPDEPVRIRAGRMPGARILGFAGLYALIVLLFALRQFADSIPLWLSPGITLVAISWGVMLHKTRFRGTPGVFELDEDSLTWFERDRPARHVIPREIPPVDVLLESIQQIRLESLRPEHGRKYVKVSVRRDGAQSVLAEKVTTAAASRLAETLTSRSDFAGSVVPDPATAQGG
ncbi:DUF6346 domain-containing protein [Amycolatopsis sp. lyj-112]|uniref:DUF6346 domain-containing protein n=1 Tax=Amycolatopsis sp. lyj-112 TaxID=2789288 RepID=UPI00397970DB